MPEKSGLDTARSGHAAPETAAPQKLDAFHGLSAQPRKLGAVTNDKAFSKTPKAAIATSIRLYGMSRETNLKSIGCLHSGAKSSTATGA